MDDALRPARHLSEKVPEHPEKSGTSESKSAVNNPLASSRGKHGYKMQKLKNNSSNFPPLTQKKKHSENASF